MTRDAESTNSEWVNVTLDDADEPAAIAVELSTVSFCVTVYPIVELAAVVVVLLTV
ncbi:MAG: hypothetical protein ACP5OJ_04895 [Methanothermobacter sp.]